MPKHIAATRQAKKTDEHANHGDHEFPDTTKKKAKSPKTSAMSNIGQPHTYRI